MTELNKLFDDFCNHYGLIDGVNVSYYKKNRKANPLIFNELAMLIIIPLGFKI